MKPIATQIKHKLVHAGCVSLLLLAGFSDDANYDSTTVHFGWQIRLADQSAGGASFELLFAESTV